MISTRNLDSLQRATVVDSLRDMAEGYSAAYDAAPDEYYRRMADAFERVADAFAAGVAISENEQGMAIDALESSQANCLDLNLMAEANEYDAANAAVRTL